MTLPMPGNSEVLLGYSRIGRAPTPEVVADALDADPTGGKKLGFTLRVPCGVAAGKADVGKDFGD